MSEQPGIEWSTAGEMGAALSALRMLIVNQYRLQNGLAPMDIRKILADLNEEFDKDLPSNPSAYMKEYFTGRRDAFIRLSEIPDDLIDG